MVPIHVMQGRLLPPDGSIQSFPIGRWEEEFALCNQIDIGGIEWIYDHLGSDHNPISDPSGIEKIKLLSSEYQIKVESLCADWFLDLPIFEVSEKEQVRRKDRLRWLLQHAAELGIKRVVLPFVDNSSLKDLLDAAYELVSGLIPLLEALEIELHLETDLAPQAFAELIDRLDHRLIRINYDSGNSASLGYSPEEEFAAYGHRVGSVHIKDRLDGGGTVPLGNGSADLSSVVALLKKIGWQRPLVLQVAREVSGEEVTKVQRDAAFVRQLWQKADLPEAQLCS